MSYVLPMHRTGQLISGGTQLALLALVVQALALACLAGAPPGVQPRAAKNSNPRTTAARRKETAWRDQPHADPPNTNPYELIVERNAFGLKPLPSAPPPRPSPPAAVLSLTGVTSGFFGKKAMFVEAWPDRHRVNSGLLGEREQDAVITNLTVLSIDVKAATALVLYGGHEISLSLTNNGLAPTAIAAVESGARYAPFRRPAVSPYVRRVVIPRAVQ